MIPEGVEILQRIYETPRCPVCDSIRSRHLSRSRGQGIEYRRCISCGGTLRGRLVYAEIMTDLGPRFVQA